jgi:hypothetical protein
MTGVRLATALDVSDDGRYIIGEGYFASQSADPFDITGYILCYADEATEGGPCPEGGLTTPDSQQSSLGDVQGTRAGVVNHTGGVAGTLLGSTDPIISGGNSATALAAVGSLTVGFKGNYAFDNGLTLIGGVAYSDFDVAGLKVGGALIAASGLRYVFEDRGGFKPFVEVGGWLSPTSNVTVSRTYANGAGTATGIGTTTSSLGSIYARGGVIFEPTNIDEVAVSATAAVNWLSMAGYTEAAGAGNPFPATFSAVNDVTTSVVATVAWTHEINEKIDMTLSASLGGLFGIDPVNATVAGLGAMTTPGGNALIGAVGARIGYKITEDLTVNGFLATTFGSTGGTHIQVGVGLSLKF